MTAKERIQDYPQKLREYTNYAVRGIKKVCDECGPRVPCSAAERKSQEMMAKDMESCCDEVRLEPFKTAPHGFLGWARMVTVFGLVSMALYFFDFAWISLILLGLSIFFFTVQFLFYKEVFDLFMPKKPSQNMVAVQKPTGDVKRRIILCGHADSVYEFSFFYWANRLKFPGLNAVLIVGTLGTVIFGAVISLIAVITGQINFVFSIIFIALAPFMVIFWTFNNYRRPIIGANDNLTGCYVPMALARMLHETGNRLQNTELVILCSGCEEAGLRGSKAFVNAHKEEYNDVETLFVGVDTMTDYEHIAIMIRDRTGTVKLDQPAAAMMKQAGHNAGQNIPYRSVYFGSTDAAAAALQGMRSISFAAMDPAPAAYYHTRFDNADALQPKTMETCLNILTETVQLFDEAGLAPFEGAKAKLGK